MKRAKIIVAALLAALFTWLAAQWVGYDLGLTVGDQPLYEIVNDEYSAVQEIPEAGLYQTVTLPAGQELYGVRLKFSTYGSHYQSGMTMVDVYDEDGALVGQAAADFLTIWNDTFTPFVFGGESIRYDRDATLTLHIHNPVAWPGPLGLWVSEGQVGVMALSDGTEPLNATAALQYVVDYSGRWPGELANRLALLLAAAVGAAVLLLFCKGGTLPLAAAVVGVLLGSAFAFVTPPLVAPDEYTHLAVAYQAASEQLGTPQLSKDSCLMVRACDAPYFGTKTGDVGIYAYKTMAQGLGDIGCDPALTVASNAKVTTGRGVFAGYSAQSFGIKLARQRGLGFHGMLVCGRLANLALYLLLAVGAVALAPASAQGILACAALLPMPLQLAGSLSPDATLLGFAFAYTALCLRLREKKAEPYEIVLLLLFAIEIGPMKAIYLPVVLLCLVIPPEHLSLPFKAAVCLAAALLWAVANEKALLYAARDLSPVLLIVLLAVVLVGAAVLVGVWRLWVKGDAKRRKVYWMTLGAVVLLALPVAVWRLGHLPGGPADYEMLAAIQPNGDSAYTFSFGYILRNLPATLKVLLHSIPEQGALWLQGLLGTTLGEPIVYRIDVSWLLGIGLLLALLAAALPVTDRPAPLQGRARWAAGGIALGVVALSFLVALGWTPINYQSLFGQQGRYWLPVLPLALLWLRGSRRVTAQGNLSRPAVFAVTCLTALTVLQGFGLYAAFTQ